MDLLALQASISQLPRLSDIRLFGRDPCQRAVLEPLMRELGVKPVQVDDLSSMLGLTRGRVFAVRWDLATGEIGFKQPVLSSLLLFHLWRRRMPLNDVGVLIDGGNVNTGLALAALAEALCLQGEHIISRHFPDDIRAYIRSRGLGWVKLIEAPASAVGREREFYSFLMEYVRISRRRRTHLCLWHAKYSGIATRWLGEGLAESLTDVPDDIVLGLGSGSTLEGYAIPLKQRFAHKPRIIIAEHTRSPLVCDAPVAADLPPGVSQRDFTLEYRLPPQSVPHAVLGPHYDDLNPFISQCSLREIDAVARYSDPNWQEISHRCWNSGIPVGNSSAANLAVSRHLALQGRTVFTFIYEPLRQFYIQERQASPTGFQEEFPAITAL